MPTTPFRPLPPQIASDSPKGLGTSHVFDRETQGPPGSGDVVAFNSPSVPEGMPEQVHLGLWGDDAVLVSWTTGASRMGDKSSPGVTPTDVAGAKSVVAYGAAPRRGWAGGGRGGKNPS